MKAVLKIISYLGLALTIIPVFFVLGGSLDDASYKTLLLVGTLCWFFTAPFWMFGKKE
ncbi:hypothetical protein [Ulvibacterium sp.]|uniref:hypothetical protein n=1 Tax=Ulvibacterium sp. TaxID=2665914 RepID=UPI00262777C9|nr:hypothetical protein [Ulvibacterium sp.]